MLVEGETAEPSSELEDTGGKRSEESAVTASFVCSAVQPVVSFALGRRAGF